MGLFHHHKSPTTKLAGIQIQTSLLGVPVAVGWGRTRVGCNLIDYVNFQAVAKSSSSGSSGGKGLGGGSSTTTWSYTASVVMALCEGPLTGIVTVYKDSSVYNSLSAAGLAGLMTGTMTQTPWSYLTSLYPSHALSYHGIAYVYAQDYPLSSGASLSNHAYEVDFATVPQVNPSGGVHDANPKDILTDFFTNVRYGVSGWGSGLLADWTDYSNYCLSAGLLLSPLLDTDTSGKSFVDQVMQETNSDCIWSEGVLKIKSYGDAPLSGNGATWNPNLAPIYNLTEDDFLDEVQLEIQDQASAANMVQIEYRDRASQYQNAIVPAYDLNDITTYGLRKQSPQSFHHICDGTIARLVGQLWLQRQLFIRDLYHFTLPQDYVGLEPMDYVSLTTTVDGMTLTNKLVMIVQIDEDAEADDRLHFVAEGIPGAAASAPLYAPHNSSGYVGDPEAAPGSVATPYIWNAPQALTHGGYEAWAAVAGTNSNWGGAFVWASFDNVNYSQVGTINGPARYGVLSAALPSHADPDTADTLSVDLTISAGTLATVTQAEADAGATLCWVDGELIGYETATLTSTSKYNLTYLRRGQQGSVIGAHAINSEFVRLDSAVYRYAYLPQHVGQTVYLKFQSFNVYGRGLQDISTCTAYSLTLNPTGSTPIGSPSGLGLAQGGTTWTGSQINLICNPVPGATTYNFNFYKSDGTTLIRTVTSATPAATYTSTLANQDGAQRTYKVSVTPVSAAGAGTASSQITITNAAPAAVSSPSAAGGTYNGTVTCTASTDPDVVGYAAFYSATSGFNPATDGSIALAGGPSVTIGGLAAGTYYCKIAAYDGWTYDPTQLNLSAEMSFAITTGTAGGSTGGTGTGGYSGGGGGGTGGTGGRLHYY